MDTRCRFCSHEVHLRARVCPSCGATCKSKYVAGWLALLLGNIGVHRFYLRQWQGLVYLLFSWTFIPYLVAIVEAIVLFRASHLIWQREYGFAVPKTGGTLEKDWAKAHQDYDRLNAALISRALKLGSIAVFTVPFIAVFGLIAEDTSNGVGVAGTVAAVLAILFWLGGFVAFGATIILLLVRLARWNLLR